MQIRGMGHLFRPKYKTLSGETREQAIYWWKAPNGQRMSTGLRDHDAAQRWALERANQLRLGEPLVAAAPVKYDDLERMLLEDWTAKERRGLPSAVARLKHLRRAFQGWTAPAITTDRVTSYALIRRKEGAAPATINIEIALLHRGFVLAKRAGKLRDIPIMDRLRDIGHRTGTVERGDLEAILARMDHRYHGALRFLYWTGWRRCEALSLTWQHVDLDAREVRLVAERSKTAAPRLLCYASLPELVALMDAQHKARRFSPYVFPGQGRPPPGPLGLGQGLETGLPRGWGTGGAHP